MLLKPADAAARIGITVRAYHNLRTYRGLPTKRRGYIDPAVLDAWWSAFIQTPQARYYTKVSPNASNRT